MTQTKLRQRFKGSRRFEEEPMLCVTSYVVPNETRAGEPDSMTFFMFKDDFLL